ncbi:hypothetical protein AAC691_06865 [Nguyenibacter vanlangensis]|uniref:Uncharacterized protein n=1 Tax=Nguyenibacter vanlangensis TaxID=1216886 RepID=A0ABZ3D8L5_9PROT
MDDKIKGPSLRRHPGHAPCLAVLKTLFVPLFMPLFCDPPVLCQRAPG